MYHVTLHHTRRPRHQVHESSLVLSLSAPRNSIISLTRPDQVTRHTNMPSTYSEKIVTRSSQDSRRPNSSGDVEILPIIDASQVHKSSSGHRHKHKHSHSSSSNSSKSSSSAQKSSDEVVYVKESSSGSKQPRIAEKVLCEDSRGKVYKIEYLDKFGNLVKKERVD